MQKSSSTNVKALSSESLFTAEKLIIQEFSLSLMVSSGSRLVRYLTADTEGRKTKAPILLPITTTKRFFCDHSVSLILGSVGTKTLSLSLTEWGLGILEEKHLIPSAEVSSLFAVLATTTPNLSNNPAMLVEFWNFCEKQIIFHEHFCRKPANWK